MIEVKNISKELYSDSGLKKYELKNISLTIHPGKVTTILGASGSGKSTLLKIISALSSKSNGEVLNSSDQKIVYIPSSPSSFPWLSVTENITFNNKSITKAEVSRLIGLVELDGYENFFPNNKSLGFRFRVSLARSLANNPSLTILDDPFKLMDTQTKRELYTLVASINKKEGITFLLGTTNIQEAIILSDHVYLLRSHSIEGVLKEKAGIDIKNIDSSQSHSILQNHIEKIIQKLNSEELAKISF